MNRLTELDSEMSITEFALNKARMMLDDVLTNCQPAPTPTIEAIYEMSEKNVPNISDRGTFNTLQWVSNYESISTRTEIAFDYILKAIGSIEKMEKFLEDVYAEKKARNVVDQIKTAT